MLLTVPVLGSKTRQKAGNSSTSHLVYKPSRKTTYKGKGICWKNLSHVLKASLKLLAARRLMGRCLKGKLPTSTSFLRDELHVRRQPRQKGRETKNCAMTGKQDSRSDPLAGENVRIQRGELRNPAMARTWTTVVFCSLEEWKVSVGDRRERCRSRDEQPLYVRVKSSSWAIVVTCLYCRQNGGKVGWKIMFSSTTIRRIVSFLDEPFPVWAHSANWDKYVQIFPIFWHRYRCPQAKTTVTGNPHNYTLNTDVMLYALMRHARP